MVRSLRSITTLALAISLAPACAWHEVSPRMGRAPTSKLGASVALRATDEETAMADLQAISRRFQKWGSAKVTFPYREGDPVDVIIDVRLRQTAETHMFANVMSALAVGLTLGLLSPVLGPRLSEVHDVRVSVTRAGQSIGEHHFEMRTDLAFGLGASPQEVTKALDDEQMNRIAKQLFELVAADIRGSASPGRTDHVAMKLSVASH